MSDMINKTSFSYEEILNELKKVLKERYAETDAAWEDFYAFGTGQIILELLAGLGSFTTYSAVANRRESYLTHTVLASSARAIAAPLGYSAYRGNNSGLSIDVHAHALTNIKRLDKIGYYEDDSGVYDILSTQDYTLDPPSSGNSIPSKVEAVIGNLATTSQIFSSHKPQILRYTQEGISDHFYLKLNGKIVPHSEDVIDLIHGKYVCLTNAHGSLDIMAMNDYLAPEHRFQAGYELEVIYIPLKEIVKPQLANTNISIGSLENLQTGLRYQDPDTVEEIQVKAPLRHETGRVIRGRDDYMKRLEQELPNVIDVNARDLDSANLALAYILDSDKDLTDAELTAVRNNIANAANRPMGVKPPELSSGNREQIKLDVQVVLRSSLISTASVVDDVVQSVKPFERKLGKRVDLYDIEDAIRNELHYAKAVRVRITPNPDLSDEELETYQPLNIAWNQYYEFQPRVQLLDTARDFFEETAPPVQPV
ncbi:hypothetical protein [Pseudoalteromonas umbrosa]|uniref:hypothetical protein n=1 Tax=Pseudoalteromonas umbrosa TaxID=3048489 RepID=UPI0024C470F9|nr:hypothetical protein [Pseudoalteromonas sp. B95]MDK1290225.1 hypothetical protein [Pseudoalteromonas sp. B95]